MSYPTHAELLERCSHLASSNQKPFFEQVAADVDWEVMGTHPAAGHFHDLETWKVKALGTINKVLQSPLQLKVRNIIAGGEWATVELEAFGTCKNGMPYNQTYAWVMRFDEQGTIVQVRAYLDSALVQQAVHANS
ncbi:hypothetical protein MBLNU230_g4455t1 [Neophaeotheca triangularis]